MISFLLFLIQFAIDYVMLVVHLYFIIQLLSFYALHMVPPPAHRWPHQSGCDLASCPLPHHSCPFEPFFLFSSPSFSM